MTSQSRKVAEFAMGNSLEMFVLILITLVTAAVGDHLSCEEYCNSLKTAQIGSTQRSECNCHLQNAVTDKIRNLGNPIYYEPLEFHPLPDISFVYQPFVISNPTSSTGDKPTTKSLSSQETEHHKKYKRKDNIIHKISIDTSKNPLYLDIDIKNGPERGRSSQNYVNEFDDLQRTEQDLKDCIDLHLLFHLRRNESDERKSNLTIENLDKYFHISDVDLMTELSKRCKQPCDIVDQSLRQIKERIRVIKPQYRNYSENDTKHKSNMSLETAHEDINRTNKPIISISTEVPGIIPEKLLSNINKEKSNGSHDITFDEKYINDKIRLNHTGNAIIRINEESPSMTQIQLELDKLVNIEKSTETNPKNETSKHIDTTKTIQENVNYPGLFNQSKLEQDPELSKLAKLRAQLSTLDTEEVNDKELDRESVMNGAGFLRMAPSATIIRPQYAEENNHSEKFPKNEMFSTTTQNTLTDTAFVTLGSDLNKNVNTDDASISHYIINTSTLKMENDLEHSSSNIDYVIVRSTNNLPELTTKTIFSKSKEKPRLNKLLHVDNIDRNKYDTSSLPVNNHFKNNFTAIMDTPNSDSALNELDDTFLVPTTEGIVPNNNRTVIPESKLQIPRIFVTEYSNETVNSKVYGIEEIPNNDYLGITNFEMDVSDLTSNKVKSVEDDRSSVENGEHTKTTDNEPIIDKNFNVKEAEKRSEPSNISEISGNLYFMFKKLLIPMRFIQTPDGELKLIIDGADGSFCKKLLAGANANNNGILSILCNSAVHDKSKYTKT